MPELPVALNRYVRVLENGDIEVWYLPGGLPDGTLLYGMEFCFTLLADAQTLKSEHVLNRGLLGVNPAEFPEGETAYIGNGSYEIPSIGEIFFVTMFGKYFDSIYIESANYLSTRVVVEGESAWIHADLNELTESGS